MVSAVVLSRTGCVLMLCYSEVGRAVLCCAVLCCAVLCCAVLCCVVQPQAYCSTHCLTLLVELMVCVLVLCCDVQMS